MNGGKLYIVSIAAGSILHRGDMSLFDEIAWRIEQGEDFSNEARRYWDGELTKDPCVEVLVRAGTIVDLIEDEYEREAEFQTYMRRDARTKNVVKTSFLKILRIREVTLGATIIYIFGDAPCSSTRIRTPFCPCRFHYWVSGLDSSAMHQPVQNEAEEN